LTQQTTTSCTNYSKSMEPLRTSSTSWNTYTMTLFSNSG
jgi:hypothetical protein